MKTKNLHKDLIQGMAMTIYYGFAIIGAQIDF